MQITDGQITNLNFTNSDLTGQVELKWFAVATDTMKSGAMAKITSWPAELLKSTPLSKAAYHVPILVGAVPFDLRISLGFSFIPAFTSKNSVVEGSKLIKYSGSGGFVLSSGQTRPSGSINVQGNVTGQDNRVVAAGPVGFTAATEAPRLELTMGWPPASLPVAGYPQLHRFLRNRHQRHGQSDSMSDQHHGFQRERRTGLHVTKHLRNLA